MTKKATVTATRTARPTPTIFNVFFMSLPLSVFYYVLFLYLLDILHVCFKDIQEKREVRYAQSRTQQKRHKPFHILETKREN